MRARTSALLARAAGRPPRRRRPIDGGERPVHGSCPKRGGALDAGERVAVEDQPGTGGRRHWAAPLPGVTDNPIETTTMNRLILATILTATLPAGGLLAQGGHDHGGHEHHGAEAPEAAAKGKEQQPQSSCPITGKPIDRKHFADYEGQRVYFCSDKCGTTFGRFPDRYLYEMHAGGQRPENVQSTCPVSGEKLENRTSFVDVLNKRIYTCCEKCAAKVKADPATYLDRLEGRGVQSKCPVRGGAVNPEVFAVVQGQKVFFCCPGCDEAFRADADRYWEAMARSKVVTQPAAMTCPVTGEPVENKALFVTWQGRRVHFCCEKCLASFIKDPGKHLGRI